MTIAPRKFKLIAEIENVKIFISMIGGLFYHEGAYSTTHSHNSYEFHFVHEGESIIDCQHKKIHLKQNEACIVSPNVIHTGTPKTEKHLKSTFCFYFEKIKRKTENNLYEFFQTEFGKIDEVKKIERAGRFAPELHKLLTAFQSGGSFASQRVTLCFSMLMLSILEEISGGRVENTEIISDDVHAEKNIRRIMMEDFVNQNYDTDISLKSLADALFLSTKQTERIFKKEMGMNFRDFVQKIRLEAAMYYLLNTDMSVHAIAEKAGYKSYNGFYKLFLSEMGCSPKNYRRYEKETKYQAGETIL